MMSSKKIFFSACLIFTFVILLSACGGSGGESSQENTQTSEPVAEIEKETSKGVAVANKEVEEMEKPAPEKIEEPKEEASKEKVEEKPKKKVPKKRAKMHFPEKVYDYGFIMQGDTVTHDFYFENVGNADLVIKKVNPSCGCTVPIYPKEPIPPGGNGKISVTFKSAGKLGRQVPNISVYTNYKRMIKLELKGFVDAERAKPAPVVEEKKDTTQQ